MVIGMPTRKSKNKVYEDSIPTISDRGVQSLKESERFRSKPYKDSAGHWTIGYGTKLRPSDLKKGYIELSGQKYDISKPIDEPTATEMMMKHPVLSDIKKSINRHGRDLNQNQIDALYEFGYNLGPSAVTSVLKSMQTGGIDAAASKMSEYNKARDRKTNKLVVSKGLTDRRNREIERFREQVPQPKPEPIMLQEPINTAEDTLSTPMMYEEPLQPAMVQQAEDEDFLRYLGKKYI